MARADWSKHEVELTVADYFAMWAAELCGTDVNKAAHNRALVPMLKGRSPQAVEFKHANISAVMIELGLPYIAGYKPRGNYQELLRHAVIEHIALNPSLDRLAKASAEAPVTAEERHVANWAAVFVDPPDAEPAPVAGHSPASSVPRPTPVDYLELEARNQSLGRAGELFVLELERRRLWECGKKTLADKVEHVALTRGDGLGYDVASFNENGSDRLIEVTTTRYGQMTPFFVTRNEVTVSRREAHRYYLFRVFAFDREPRVFVLPGALETRIRLEPSNYKASFRLTPDPKMRFMDLPAQQFGTGAQ